MQTILHEKVKINSSGWWLTLMLASIIQVTAFGQEVRGTVSDENNQPIPGATVLEKGTGNGTVTDVDGKFLITVNNEEAVLVFSFIGYETKNIEVGNQSEINITMEPNLEQLEEVIVTGYRTQARGTVTGSVASVNSAEFQDIPTDNLSNALAGRLTGVTVTQNAGTPGRESNVRIRAAGTFNNSQPLYVIDGVVNDKFAFDGLSPNEVESVTVLKDGASAAIYGSRAANGVVLVTTRRGEEGAPKLNYNGSVGIQSPTRIAPRLNALEHATLINNALDYIGAPENDNRYYTQDELDYYRDNSWDWVEELWQNPVTNQQTLNISGGSKTVDYFLAGSYNHATGSFNNLDFTKINLRGNVDVKVTDDLTASLDMSTDSRKRNGPAWGGNDWGHEDLYKALVLRSSMVPPYINGLPTGNYVEWHPGAVINGDAGYNRRNWDGLETKLALSYKVPFIEGLNAKMIYNIYKREQHEKHFNLPYEMTLFNQTGGNGHIVGDTPVGIRPRSAEDYLRERHDQFDRYQFNINLNYQRSFGDHTVDALFVYEQAETDQVWIEARRDNFISPSIDQFIGGSAAPEDSRANGSQIQTARVSYVGLLGYNYQDKYLLESSFRYDGSMVFAPENRWGFFPSFSAGWRISNESFFTSSFFDDLKMRASYGVLGNDQVGYFQWLQSYNITEGAVFESPSIGLSPGSLINRDLTWEKSQSQNLGVDASFLKNKMDFKLDLFYRNTYDILGSRQTSIPSTFGASLPDENYQKIQSKGFEVELGYKNSFGNFEKPINYYLRANFAYAVNKVIRLDEAENLRPYQSQIGYNTGRIFGYVATDILRTQEDLDALPEGYTILGEEPRLGMLNYKDVRGPNSDEPDGRITSDDQEYIARFSSPPMNYGLSMGFSYGAFRVDALIQGVAGHKAMIHSNARRVQGRVEEGSYGFWADHWTPDNTDADYPAPRRVGWPPTDFPASSWFVRDASFVRLKNLNISYSLPKSLTSMVNVDDARLFFTGTNLFLIHDNIGDFGYDPEANSIRSYPIMRTLSFGLNVNL